MEDGVVDDTEVEQQGKCVAELFGQLAKTLPPEHQELVSRAIAELCVLNAICRVNQAHI